MGSGDEAPRESAQREFFARRHVYLPGTPIFDAIGMWIGIVDSEYVPVHGADLMMRPGWFAHRHVPVPLTTITRMDPDGIYLDVHDMPPVTCI